MNLYSIYIYIYFQSSLEFNQFVGKYSMINQVLFEITLLHFMYIIIFVKADLFLPSFLLVDISLSIFAEFFVRNFLNQHC